MLPTAFNKDAFPHGRHPASRTKSFSLPKQAQVSRVNFQTQYQAFVRFAVTSSAAVSAVALQWNPSFGTFHSGRAPLEF